MTKQEFQEMWAKATPVKSNDFSVARPSSNFASFPEEITGELTEGVVYGIHCSHEPIEAFCPDFLTCVRSIDVPIEQCQKGNGQYVYLVKVFGDEVIPALIVDNGDEYRQIAGLCSFRKI